jgi:uncharacterized integral membrane protein
MDEFATPPGPEDGVGIPEIDAGKRPRRSISFPWRLVLALSVFALVVLFVLQNTDSVEVTFLWFEFRAPLIVLLVAAMVLSVVMGDLLDVWWSRRKRKREEG